MELTNRSNRNVWLTIESSYESEASAVIRTRFDIELVTL